MLTAEPLAPRRVHLLRAAPRPARRQRRDEQQARLGRAQAERAHALRGHRLGRRRRVAHRCVPFSLRLSGPPGTRAEAGARAVKYFSPRTNVCIVRVARDQHRTARAAVTLLAAIDGRRCVPHVVHVSGTYARPARSDARPPVAHRACVPGAGTIKQAQLAAIRHNRTVIARYRALAKTPGPSRTAYAAPRAVQLLTFARSGVSRLARRVPAHKRAGNRGAARLAPHETVQPTLMLFFLFVVLQLRLQTPIPLAPLGPFSQHPFSQRPLSPPIPLPLLCPLHHGAHQALDLLPPVARMQAHAHAVAPLGHGRPRYGARVEPARAEVCGERARVRREEGDDRGWQGWRRGWRGEVRGEGEQGGRDGAEVRAEEGEEVCAEVE